MTVAPAIAAKEEGGTGAQKSSQMSMARRKPGMSAPSKIRSAPNGTSWPAMRMVRETASADEAN